MQTTASKDFASAIYVGELHHRRQRPFTLGFKQKLFMFYLDLDELPFVFSQSRWWSRKWPALAGFKRADYLGDPGLPLDTCVRRLVKQRTGRDTHGPIRLLAHTRCLGFCFNPIAIYYCFNKDNLTLEAVVAEVTNTPWGERHQYVLSVVDGAQGDADSGHSSDAQTKMLRFSFEKALHVSPFFPMHMRYLWRCNVPGDRLIVQIGLEQDDTRHFDAGLTLKRESATGLNLRRTLIRFPLMPWQVVANIYWQALKLWLSGARYHTKPAGRLDAR